MYHAVAKIDGGTKEKGSSIFAICELERVRQSIGDGFRSTVGDGDGGDDDDGGDVDWEEEVGEERMLTGYECLLSEDTETQLTDQSWRKACSRQEYLKVSVSRTKKAERVHENLMHSTSARRSSLRKA